MPVERQRQFCPILTYEGKPSCIEGKAAHIMMEKSVMMGANHNDIGGPVDEQFRAFLSWGHNSRCIVQFREALDVMHFNIAAAGAHVYSLCVVWAQLAPETI